MKVLGITVERALLERWRDWLMPAEQPYVVPRAVARLRGLPDDRARLSMELLDSFELYGATPADAVVWLDRSGARTLPADVRRAQPAPHRWPTGDVDADLLRVVRRIESGRRPSRHAAVPAEVWEICAARLPGARQIAGTFPAASGPNCFGTVMGAAGVAGAATSWVQTATFESWLHAATAPTRSRDPDSRAGTVLVWRDADGVLAHAAVTLGGGWLVQKWSQGWLTPVTVEPLRDGMSAARTRGQHVSRRTLIAAEAA